MMLALLLLVQEDVEAKEKRLAELVAEAIEVFEKAQADSAYAEDPKVRERMEQIQAEGQPLMDELTGGDKGKEEAVVEAVLKKHAPDAYKKYVKMRIPANERNASATIKSVVTAQENFRSNDLDRNQTNDYWVADVSGLYRIVAGEQPIAALMDLAAAAADAAPAVPIDKEGEIHGVRLAAMDAGKPKAGYRYAVVKQYASGDKTEAYDQADGRNFGKFAVCAFPADYGVTGNLTFIIDESATVYQKDTGGKGVDVWPANLDEAGWKKVE